MYAGGLLHKMTSDRQFRNERHLKLVTDEELNDEKLTELMQQREAQRVQACKEAIESALSHYECELVAEPYIQQGVIVAAVRLNPKRK